jgi:ATP-binding cassette, subfamily F, member 3
MKIYQGIDFEAERGLRTVLVGPNGAGKSTLLKILGGVLTPQQGTRTLGHNTHVGYYSQNRVEMLDPTKTVLQEVMSIAKPVAEVQARTVLGSFLFSGDDAFKKTGVLSGGEKSRLALVKLLLDPPNLLLMDEPTTHLDMASIDALIDALNQYEGTLVFISHDVYFIKALAKTVLHISAGKPTPYSGNYDYYLEKSQATSEREGLVAGQQLPHLSDQRPAETVATPRPSGSGGKTKEQKRREAEERQSRSAEKKNAQANAHRLEQEITRLEARQKEIAAQLEDSSFYSGGGDVMSLNRELISNAESLDRLNDEWQKAITLLDPTPSS